MKLKKLEYEDEEYQWRLNCIEFLPNLNLLVGISGAGKTQILKAIKRLQMIANGISLNGVSWDVTFLTQDEHSYRWRGKFETIPNNLIIKSDSEQESTYHILYEYLDKDEQSIIERTKPKGIIFQDKLTPKLSPFKSVIELLSEEEDIKRY